MDYLRQLINLLKHAIRFERRSIVKKSHEIEQLSKQIVDYGRMIKQYEDYSGQFVLVEILELASRLRETEEVIQDALRLLEHEGLAGPLRMRGCWRLRVTDVDTSSPVTSHSTSVISV